IGTGSSSSGTLSDFWEYDAISDTWTQKSNFPGGLRYEGTAFSIGGFGFMGGGYGPLPRNDFWRYDPQTDTWTPIALLPHNGVVETVCFSIGNYAYLGTGWDGTNFMNNFWQYSAEDRKSTRLNSSHVKISYAVFCLKKKKTQEANEQLKVTN